MSCLPEIAPHGAQLWPGVVGLVGGLCGFASAIDALVRHRRSRR